MIAAVYARKSTDQSDVSDAAKSVTRQIEQAKAYSTRKGWAVADAHVYADDGISGAEFSARPGFVRLMNALKPRPGSGVLIMSEESRLGREQIETSYSLKQILQAGVRVFYYLEDRERTLGSPTDKLLLSVTAFADELEREKARQRTYDAVSRIAKAGHVAGGQCFGYDNVPIAGPDGRRSHVERRINATEAAVVRRIFELCAAGYGYRKIAITLNDERAVSPRAQRGGRRVGRRRRSTRRSIGRSIAARSCGTRRASGIPGAGTRNTRDRRRSGCDARRRTCGSCRRRSGVRHTRGSTRPGPRISRGHKETRGAGRRSAALRSICCRA